MGAVWGPWWGRPRREHPLPRARRDLLSRHPAEPSRPAPARGRGHRDDPRPGADDAALPGHGAADPRGDPDLRPHRGGDHVPDPPGVRVAGQRHADGERRRAHPARAGHASGRPLEHLRLVGVRRRRRVLADDQVPHPLPRLARVQPVEHRPRDRVHRVREHTGRAARLLVGTPRLRDAPGLCRDPRRRAHHHRPHRAARHGGDVLADAGGRDRCAGGIGPLHGGPLGVRARLRLRLLAGHHHLARDPDLPLLHDHGPEDRADRTPQPDRVRLPRRRGQHPADGAADHRVRDEGRAARRAGRHVRRPPHRRSTALRPAIAPGRSRRADSRPAGGPGTGPAAPGSALPGARRRARHRHRRRRRPGSRRRHGPRRRAGPGPPPGRSGDLPLDHRRAGRPRLEPRDHRRRRAGDRPDPGREPGAGDRGAAASRPDHAHRGRPRRPAGRDAGPAEPEHGERDDRRRPLPDRRHRRQPARPLRQAGRPEPRPAVPRHGDDGDLRRRRPRPQRRSRRPSPRPSSCAGPRAAGGSTWRSCPTAPGPDRRQASDLVRSAPWRGPGGGGTAAGARRGSTAGARRGAGRCRARPS